MISKYISAQRTRAFGTGIEPLVLEREKKIFVVTIIMSD